MKIESRKQWSNIAGNQQSVPMLSFWPESREDIAEIILRAEQDNRRVRAVGSSHSWSDVARTEDYLVYPQKLNRVLDVHSYQLREHTHINPDFLMYVQSGITIRELNDVLDGKGLALINLGGYDGQTVCGVTSTSTHGSGIQIGPLSDFIQSMEVVGDHGKCYRIEPSVESGRALTDPEQFRAAFPDREKFELVQDDQWFNASLVGMGCLGVIYAVVLKVRSAFLLRETRTLTTWRAVKEDLKNGGIYHKKDHYELLLNPYVVDGEHRCLITHRVETEKPGDRSRSIYVKYKAVLDVSAWFSKLLAWLWPSKIKNTLNSAIGALEDDDYTEKSYRVFHIGEANDIPVLSSEFAVPVERDMYIRAIEILFETAEKLGREEHLYLTVPLAVRFVHATDALLSPQNRRDTCMLEVIGLKGVKNTVRIMAAIEEALRQVDVRPHWGQLNHMQAKDLRDMYGSNLERWREVYQRLNGQGTFSSAFTARMGFDQH
ncbi:FAD-binding protein [bacterium]|nr:FAD-binding protein [bacterium]